MYYYFFNYDLGLKGNPLAPEIMNIYAEVNGTHKLLTYMLDHLHVTSKFYIVGK